MANKLQIKSDGRAEFSENDPFAELTRIMGFDPRKETPPPVEDDFGIDLEQELLGELAADPLNEFHRQSARDETQFVVPAAVAPTEHVEASSADRMMPARAPDAPDQEPILDEEFEKLFASAVVAEAALPAYEPASGHSDGGNVRTSAAEYPHAAGAGVPDLDHVDLAAEMENWAMDAAAVRSLPVEAQAVPVKAQAVAPEAETAAIADAAGNDRAAPARDVEHVENGAAQIHAADLSLEEELHALLSGAPEAEKDPAALATEGGQETRSAAPVAIPAMDANAALRKLRAEWRVSTPAAEPARREAVTVQTAAPLMFRRPRDTSFHTTASGGWYGAGDAAVAPPRDRQPSRDGHGEEPQIAPAGAAAPLGADEAETALPLRGDISEAPRDAEHAPIVVEDGLGTAEHVQPEAAAADDFELDGKLADEIGLGSVASGHVELDDAPAGQVKVDDASSEAGPVETSYFDIDTVEVRETAVVLKDDLDIPDPDFDNEVRAAPSVGLDDDFEDVFSAVPAPAGEPAVLEEVDEAALEAKIARMFSSGELDFQPGMFHTGMPQYPDAGQRSVDPVAATPPYPAAQSLPQRSPQQPRNNIFSVEVPRESGDGGVVFAEPVAIVPGAYRGGRMPGSRVVIGAAVVGIVILGGVAAFALSGGSQSDGAPFVLKADNGPMKIKPKHPGGKRILNQDNRVYETVADGARPIDPSQKQLVTSEVQPMDVAKPAPALAPAVDEAQASPPAASQAAAQADSDGSTGEEFKNLPGVTVPARAGQRPADMAKGQDRLAPSAGVQSAKADDDLVAVTAHQVRTMIVKSDGTMVPNVVAPAVGDGQTNGQAGASAMPAQSALLPSSAPIPAMPGMDVAALSQKVPTGDAASGASAVSTDDRVVASTDNKGARPATRAWHGSVRTPAHVAIAPSRPAEQPLTIVGRTGARQVASLAPAQSRAAATAEAGGWSIQIASQPTEEGARATYQNLARHYSDELKGRAVDIVKADISGRGTYYRVRIPANSKDDAITLCTHYKNAGGSCFVSK